ncbi:hypothetical protein, partial [Acinetobacter sp. NRRL B-65365]|uniref:hypothetical protein n=1 Tax=Acinetobacter sp. NRRL B-65365 TaxID=1785092 RepID=UPI000A40EB85
FTLDDDEILSFNEDIPLMYLQKFHYDIPVRAEFIKLNDDDYGTYYFNTYLIKNNVLTIKDDLLRFINYLSNQSKSEIAFLFLNKTIIPDINTAIDRVIDSYELI